MNDERRTISIWVWDEFKDVVRAMRAADRLQLGYTIERRLFQGTLMDRDEWEFTLYETPIYVRPARGDDDASLLDEGA